MIALPVALTQFGGKLLLLGRQYAPQLMTYGGIGGFVATVISACKATTKAEKILDKKEEDLKAVEDCLNDPSVDYDEAQAERDRHDICIQAKWELTKCYAPTVTLGVASTALILGGHHIIQTRSAGYAAAFKASEKAFRAYRESVAKKYGEDPERRIIELPEHKEKKDENALPTAKNGPVIDPTPDAYLAWYSKDSSTEWVDSPQFNFFALKKAQDDLNERFHGQGYLFLNDARKRLGLPYIPEGQFLGWKLRKNRGEYDNYIDFLHLDTHPNESVQALQRLEDVPVLLEFNCDGIVYEEVQEDIRSMIPQSIRRKWKYA